MAGAESLSGPATDSRGNCSPGGRQKAMCSKQLAVDCRMEWPARAAMTPGNITGVERVEVGQQLLADGGADAVGPDQESASTLRPSLKRTSPSGRLLETR